MLEKSVISNNISKKMVHIDGLEQERRNSIANALELRLCCTNPSMSFFNVYFVKSVWARNRDTRRGESKETEDESVGSAGWNAATM